jgi:hypothetical protein
MRSEDINFAGISRKVENDTLRGAGLGLGIGFVSAAVIIGSVIGITSLVSDFKTSANSAAAPSITSTVEPLKPAP